MKTNATNGRRIHMVNVQKAGEVYRCNVCGNVVLVQEAGGGEILCHGEPMQLIEGTGKPVRVGRKSRHKG